MGLFDWLPFKRKKAEKTQEELAAMRRTFAARFDHFRLLIQSNTRAHEFMAQMEEALRGFQPYSMHYVRALSTRISIAIYQMIRHLKELSPKSAQALLIRFNLIEERIRRHVERQPLPERGELVLDLAEVRRDQADLCGPKMAMLGEAAESLQLTIPDGFVITTVGFRHFMDKNGLVEEIDRIIQAHGSSTRDAMYQLSSRIMQLVMGCELPPELSQAVLNAFDALSEKRGEEVRVAVRSSALGEDIEGTAFAGQYRSVLNVDRESLLSTCKEVMASKYSPQAMMYRMARGIKDDDIAMSVGCMVMIPALCSGVVYSRNPLNIRDDNIYIQSVWGLPKGVVDGSVASDEYHLSRTGPMEVVERNIAEKNEKFICHEREGVCRMELVTKRRFIPSMTDEQALEVAEIAIRIEDHFGSPQDIEWAMDQEGQFHLLQCRPLMLVDPSKIVRPPLTSLPEPFFTGGRTAAPGVGIGPVFQVQRNIDALTFPDGGVMVVKQALPSRAMLLDRCSAVISEQGGIAGHLANVAREFGVPALFGVKNAFELFKTGEIVTVDADACTIYKGAVDSLCPQNEERKNLMSNSPVHAALQNAARHILPLNLTDPDSLQFKPANCETFHDIMRYCHEMAVREMFEFGTNEEFVEAASRQLICDVPKQFWVLNLDDGITTEGRNRKDRCVLLKHIRSIPMLALWEGMEAVPWEGPPAVNTQGFLSVMFEATMNPDLSPTRRSRFSQKNYFMISKNYCSLQSRFGFHFCGVEALVTERVAENYASFQFKGGAANLERRIMRTRFVGDILEKFDFRVRLREDNLNARVEGFDQESMLYRLKILGYLISHTRQLDMIMADKDEVARRKNKFFKDFEMFSIPHEFSDG